MRPIVILGADGQVGRALRAIDPDAVALGRDELDLTRMDRIPETLAKYKPRAIINAAAYTAVDKAESDEPRAHLINAEGPAVVAAFCKAENIPLIHYSTDYVFDGSGSEPWVENDTPAPLSAYGRTKLAGEKAIASTGCDHLIFRTSWVYDASGKNFVNTMLRLGSEREALKVVDDQVGAPTYAPHLARATMTALLHAGKSPRFPSGIYHLCNGGETNWMEFAKQIFAEGYKRGLPLKVQDVAGIPSTDYPTPAARPLNSRLDCSKAERLLGVRLPDWQEGLTACMGERV